MKKIKVQRRISIFEAVALIAIICLIVAGIFYLIFSNNNGTHNYHMGSDLGTLLCLLPIIVLLIFKDGIDKSEYVSDLIITDNSISIVYKAKGRIINVKEILLEDIKSVKTTAFIGLAESRQFYTANYITEFCLNSGENIEFKTKPSIYERSVYNFLFRMLDNAKDLPNFSYDLKCTDQTAIDDIAYYNQHGKKRKPPRRWIHNVRFVLFGLMFLCILFIAIPVYNLNFPWNKLSAQESEYMKKLERGTEYRINNNYSIALNELDSAERLINSDYQLYIEKAYAYEGLKEYGEVIIESEKALKLIDSNTKSTYTKAHNFNSLIQKNSGQVAIYTLMGNANYQLRNYKESINDYTKVIDLGTYKYTDAYFYLARSKYYYGDKSGALKDFSTHKGIVSEYLEDQRTSEYPAKYPQYNQASLANVNKWIEYVKLN